MPRYWVIAPVKSKPPELFDKVWQFDVANNLISIGWQQLGDVSEMSREKLSEAVASSYPEKPPQTKALYCNMIWAFYHGRVEEGRGYSHNARPRFPSPLIKPDVRISRIRLSDGLHRQAHGVGPR